MILSSGREIYANRGIIGIDPSGEVYEGYDGHLRFGPWYEGDESFTDPPWTDAEKRELAEHMIERWRKFGGAA